MKTIAKLLALSLMFIGTAATSFAASYRLDFSGETDTRVYSGYLLLDFNVIDSQSDETRGLYQGIATHLTLFLDGAEYGLSGDFINFASTTNFSSYPGDTFGVGVSIVDTSGGSSEFFAIQFQDVNGSIFGNDSLPGAFDLGDFDSYTVDNSYSTGVILPGMDVGTLGVSPLDFAELRPVPLPAGLVLLLSALTTFAGFRAKA